MDNIIDFAAKPAAALEYKAKPYNYKITLKDGETFTQLGYLEFNPVCVVIIDPEIREQFDRNEALVVVNYDLVKSIIRE